MLIPILVLAVGVAQGFGRFGYALLLPAVNADLVHSYAVAGLLGTLNLTAYLGGTLLVSLTAGRLAPATSVRLGLLLTTAGVSVLALAPSVPVLVAGMVLAGFGGAMIWVPAPGSPDRRPRVPSRPRDRAGRQRVGVWVIASSGLTALVHAVAGPARGARRGRSRRCSPRWSRRRRRAGCARTVIPVSGPVRLSTLRAVPGWIGSTLSYGGYGPAIVIYMTFLVAAYQDDAVRPRARSAVFALTGRASRAVGSCSAAGRTPWDGGRP